MEIEHLGRCPVCAGAERAPAYRAVRDGVFGTPGEWDFWNCRCGIVYLDPRPTRDGMAETYQAYYTHDSDGPPLKWRDPGFRGAVRRGYLNTRYGYAFADASLLGGLTWPLRRGAVKNLDFMIRHLPSPPRRNCRILDVGCGNGDFLAVAQDLGYVAVGLDPDPAAVAFARSRGLTVELASLPGAGMAAQSFDHVFMSHVLEHLHDPIGALQEVQSLLAPGGRIWLSLPNLGALGLQRFGRHWRGLEPPRHLVLFDPPRLAALLVELGFERPRLQPAEEAAIVYFRQSQAIAAGLDPYGPAEPPDWDAVHRAARTANRRARRQPLVAEALTMLAWKVAR